MNAIPADTTVEAVGKQFEILRRIWPVIKNMREIIMWPSRDERRLLRYYHKNKVQVGKESNYSEVDLVVVLYCRNSKEESDHIKRESQRKTLENLPENVQRYSDQHHRVRSANEALQQRGLIVLTPQKDSQLITLSLTAQGDDLGRNFSSRIGTSYLWCKGHTVLAIILVILTLLTTIFAGISAFKNTNDLGYDGSITDSNSEDLLKTPRED